MSIAKHAFVCSIILLCAVVASTLAADQGILRVGAIRIDITPASDAALPMSGYSDRKEGFKAIHDPLHLRTIVVDDGTNQAALVSCEVIGFSNALWDEITRNLTAATGIPRESILLAAVHTHAAPSLGVYEGKLTEKQVAYVEKLKKAIVDSVLDARKNLQPAKVGFGIGRANVNMNRRARDDQGRWMLGNNPEGVSDKTVAVIQFDSLNGEPIAIITNYGVHGTVMGPANLQISSDLPGATARFVEQHYGDKVVAPWTSGTAG